MKRTYVIDKNQLLQMEVRRKQFEVGKQIAETRGITCYFSQCAEKIVDKDSRELNISTNYNRLLLKMIIDYNEQA